MNRKSALLIIVSLCYASLASAEQPDTYQFGAWTGSTYSAPTYSAPTYSAPTYSAPTYSAPTYLGAPPPAPVTAINQPAAAAQTPSPIPPTPPTPPGPPPLDYACWSQGTIASRDFLEGAYPGSRDYSSAVIKGMEYSFPGHVGLGTDRPSAVSSAQAACQHFHPGTHNDPSRNCHLANCVGAAH